MAANAPYYQLRGQFTNGANAQFAAVDEDYDLSSSLAPHHASLYGDTQTPDTQVTSLEENHNLVELLEAATTAAGQAAEVMNVESVSSGRANQTRGKRKRVSSPSAEKTRTAAEYTRGGFSSSHKRARMNVPTDPQLHEPGQDIPSRREDSITPSSEALLSDARAAGVHSAAALFRRSSKETTKKYTRPPMSKLFVSLQLTPENFLHLQAQAKSYMLDPAHPERKNCVGNRAKGDTDMVKLRLFNCVQDFLSEGAGEQFFGERAEKPAEKETIQAARALGEEKAPDGKPMWPRDGNKIISLVTPLLRRMVTNERQRQYAIETRKGGSKKKEGSVEAPHHESNSMGMQGMGEHGQDLQPAFHDSHPLALQIQNQYSHPATPISAMQAIHPAIPDHIYDTDSPPRPTDMDTVEEQGGIELTQIKERALPTELNRPHSLRKINLFLAKNNLRLKQSDRITGPGPIADYSWAQLQGRIIFQIRLALATYPDLRPKSLRTASQDQLQEKLKGMGPEALRGLAVAATEIHNHAINANSVNPELRIDSVSAPKSSKPTTAPPPPKASSSTELYSALSVNDPHNSVAVSVDAASETASTHGIAPDSASPSPTKSRRLEEESQRVANIPEFLAQPTSPSKESASISAALTPPSAAFADPEVPRYIVKVLLTTGLSQINDEQDWKDAKMDVGYSVWANGKLSVVVELI